MASTAPAPTREAAARRDCADRATRGPAPLDALRAAARPDRRWRRPATGRASRSPRRSDDRASTGRCVHRCGRGDRGLQHERAVGQRDPPIGANSISPLRRTTPGATARSGRAAGATTSGPSSRRTATRRSARRGDVGHHVVGVVPSSRGSGRVLVLESEHVTGSFGRAVQRHARAATARRSSARDRPGPRRADRGRPPAPTRATARRADHRGRPSGRVRAGRRHRRPMPRRSRTRTRSSPRNFDAFDCQSARPFATTSSASWSSPASGRAVIRAVAESRSVRGEVELFVDPAHGVTELDSGIPERIPQSTRRRLDVLGDLLGLDVVDQQEVEVAARREFPAPVSTDRQQGHATRLRWVRSHRLVEEFDHPVVGEFGQHPAVRRVRIGRLGPPLPPGAPPDELRPS